MRNIAGLVLSLGTILSSPAAAAESNKTGLNDKSIVDLHCHIAGIGAGNSGCFLSKRLRGNFRMKIFLAAYGVTERELLENGDILIVDRMAERLNRSKCVEKAVVLALDGIIGEDGRLDRERTEMYVPDDFVIRAVSGHDNLLYGASINPVRKDALQRLERAAADGAVLVKLLPNIQLIDMADNRYRPYFRRMRELGLPLLVHTGSEHTFTWSRNEYGDPAKLKLALEEGVTVFASHAGGAGSTGGEGNLERVLQMLPCYGNLYLETAGLTLVNHLWHAGTLLKDSTARERLVYGSDMPLPETPGVWPILSIFSIGPSAFWRISREPNPWDRDVLYQRALGMPDSAFIRGNALIRIKGLKDKKISR